MLGASTILLRSSHLKFDRLVYVLNHIHSSYCCAEMALQRYTVLPDFHDLPSRIEEVTEKLYTEMLAKEEGVITSYILYMVTGMLTMAGNVMRLRKVLDFASASQCR